MQEVAGSSLVAPPFFRAKIRFLQHGSSCPKEGDEQIDSKALEDMQIQIDGYIVQFIEFIKNNRGKTRLQMESS